MALPKHCFSPINLLPKHKNVALLKPKHCFSPVNLLPKFPRSTVFPTSTPSLSVAVAGDRCGLSALSGERESGTCAAGRAHGKSGRRGTGAGWEEGGSRGPPGAGSKESGRFWSSPLSVRWTGRSGLCRVSRAETRSWTGLKSRDWVLTWDQAAWRVKIYLAQLGTSFISIYNHHNNNDNNNNNTESIGHFQQQKILYNFTSVFWEEGENTLSNCKKGWVMWKIVSRVNWRKVWNAYNTTWSVSQTLQWGTVDAQNVLEEYVRV